MWRQSGDKNGFVQANIFLAQRRFVTGSKGDFSMQGCGFQNRSCEFDLGSVGFVSLISDGQPVVLEIVVTETTKQESQP
jgi:hypothetical protein